MLTDLTDILTKASKEKYAVGHFNVINRQMIQGVFEAARTLKSPLIIGTAERFLEFITLEELSEILIPLASKADFDVCLHFDHGKTIENCKKAIELGFTSVMFDGSRMPFDENIKTLSLITDYAHSKGVSVEGELGAILDNEGSIEGTPETFDGDITDLFTNPEKAQEFTNKTKIDALAISVGNAHGNYPTAPTLDFARIKTIKEKTNIPLVLHGGSGLTDSDFKKAIACGISKVNIFTDIYDAFNNALLENTDTVLAVKNTAIKKMQLFNSYNK